jgi:hypothetical protein
MRYRLCGRACKRETLHSCRHGAQLAHPTPQSENRKMGNFTALSWCHPLSTARRGSTADRAPSRALLDVNGELYACVRQSYTARDYGDGFKASSRASYQASQRSRHCVEALASERADERRCTPTGRSHNLFALPRKKRTDYAAQSVATN